MNVKQIVIAHLKSIGADGLCSDDESEGKMKDYELLEKQAEMMRMAEKHGIDDWRKLVKVKDTGNPLWKYLNDVVSDFQCWGKYQFALGVVEGKPVFEGDELYHSSIGKVTVRGVSGSFLKIKDMQGDVHRGCAYNPETFSWNPPKPKTILVELLVEDAGIVASMAYGSAIESVKRVQSNISKALEAIK